MCSKIINIDNLRQWFRSILFVCVLLTFSLIPFVCDAQTVNLKIQKFHRTPNYALCTDSNDMIQLTDNHIEKGPIWTHTGCVGWKKKGAVKIYLRIMDNIQIDQSLSGVLRLHTARGSYADVEIPKRVDIYSKNQNGQYFYNGGKSFNSKNVPDKKSLWLDIEVTGVMTDFLIIIHPRSQFLFLDEISLDMCKAVKKEEHILIGRSLAIEQHSLALQREDEKQFLNATLSKSSTYIKNNFLSQNDSSFLVWYADNPFSQLPQKINKKIFGQSKKNIDIIGTTLEKESVCFGVVNNSDDELQLRVDIEIDPLIKNSIQMYSVEPISSGNGNVVYDPLVPIGWDEQNNINDSRINYYWLTVNLNQCPIGEYRGIIRFMDNNTIIDQSLSITITIVAPTYQSVSTKSPHAINWGYIQDTPIWNQPEMVLTDLKEHGINVFVIHPSRIPMPNKAKTWNSLAAEKFAKDVSMYKKHGLILLFLNWGEGLGPKCLNPISENIEQKRIFQVWIQYISDFLKKQGLTKEDWALYPVDEPRGGNLIYLERIARWSKEVYPDIQIYANPTTSSKSHTTEDDLLPLSSLIDLWQPLYKCAADTAQNFFKKLSKPWWIYESPPYHAKLAEPWKHYLLLSWKAWFIGAKGVGFWSYSDTSGSSAWDDFDGRRADWAVVYESLNGPVSSRRWEAFREGLEDFQLFESVLKDDLFDSIGFDIVLKNEIDSLLNQKEIFFSDRLELRKSLILPR